ncbi:hypothetical protein GWK08_07135 [Leptobacterium flavescens]|uniref:histidine kinase n=1 Tax=Leptobacterium flavescens TaxID=472055 RepID=A0A6P0UJQ1_9FLAO|nr:sensor histidine kinase [Leptobacterium flavescens]NER13207.1 hypothetical protein [Leptobacterium flavescens]
MAFLHAQEADNKKLIKDILKQIQLKEVNNASRILNEFKIKDEEEGLLKTLFLNEINYLKNGSYPQDYTSFLDKEGEEASSFIRSYILLTKSKFIESQSSDKDSLIFSLKIDAYEQAEASEVKYLKSYVLNDVLSYLFKSEQLDHFYTYYLSQYEHQVQSDYERAYFYYYETCFKIRNNDFSDASKIYKGLKLLKNDEKNLKGEFFQTIGAIKEYFFNELDSARFYYGKALNIFKTQDSYYSRSRMLGIYNNLGIVKFRSENNQLALRDFNEAKNLALELNRKRNLVDIYDWLYQVHKKNDHKDSTIYYLDKKYNLEKELDRTQQSISITELQTKYQTEKKEKENLLLKQDLLITDNRKNLAYGATAVLILTVISVVFVLKNTRKKKQLAEQQHLLKSREIENLLKDQELQQIDALIAGQEKERQRIANELHDNLGGDLATLKLHFHHLQEKSKRTKEEEKLFEKTGDLLEEAYQKTRQMAHAKNSGVIAKMGLLPAVKKMAGKISLANKIKVEVHDSGLSRRLENSLEITIFRMLQELITNCIKHAKAELIVIYLTEHEESLNIMVEDNGVGFDIKKVNKQEGMGLYSIERRAELIGGTMTVESHKNKGTTVILDIPL